MTPQEQRQQLTEEIQRLVPDIMELKFGCRVKYKSNCSGIYSVNDEDCDGWVSVQGHHSPMRSIEFFGMFEILGRDIQLADVLMALQTVDIGIYVNRWGEFVFDEDEGREDTCSWDLTKPYHLQEDETIAFLYDIICKTT